jgi:hypothetical protein
MQTLHKTVSLASRRTVRHIVAAVIWLNALFATHFIHLPSFRFSVSSSLAVDISLMSFILFYGVICDFGWISVWFDLLYIYLWPFVLLFKALFLVGKYLWRKYKPSVSSAQAATDAAKVVSANVETTKSVESMSPATAVIGVFGQFTVIWSLIILNTNMRAIAILATVAALFGALRASYNLWDFISDAIDWIESLESPFSRQLAEAIKAIRESNVAEEGQRIKNAANLLRMAEKTCNFLADKKRTLSKLTRIAAFCITIPFYIYISSIFAVIYLGIAKIEHIGLDWRSALIDSLFVPIAFTDLPHSFLIRLIAGIQAVVIGAMGYNVLFRHFTSKINRLSDTALELGRPLQDRELMSRVELYADKITFTPKPVSPEVATKNQSVA